MMGSGMRSYIRDVAGEVSLRSVLRMVMVLTLVIVVIFFLCWDIIKPRGYPPGPVWLPVVGNYLWFRQQKSHLGYHHLVWMNLSSQYGPVAGIRLGRDRIVVVSGYDAVKDVLLRDEFDGRPDGFFFRLRTFGKRMGIVFTDGPLWQEQRRFCVQHLRKLGFGTRSMEAHIEEEARDLVAVLRSRCENGSTPLKMHDAFDVSVLNSLWAMLAGHRFALDDQRLVELLDIVHICFRLIDPSGGLLNQMPFLRFIAPKKSGHVDLLKNLNRMWNFLKETIEEHRNSYTSASMRDLIDLFLQEIYAKKEPTSSFHDLQLVSLCLDLFMAGSETTSNTLGFGVLYMLLYPEIQQRVQEELDRFVGRDRQPTLQDRRSLHYVEAVLMEVQRHATIAPSGIPHRALKSTILMGYTIPKGTTVLVNIWSLHRDEKHWGDPHSFRPERFLSKQGEVIQDDWFVPFGLGKRRCIGETLARSSLFLFFSTLLHNFTVSVPPGFPAPSVDGYDGVTLSPKPFYAKLAPRSK